MLLLALTCSSEESSGFNCSKWDPNHNTASLKDPSSFSSIFSFLTQWFAGVNLRNKKVTVRRPHKKKVEPPNPRAT